LRAGDADRAELSEAPAAEEAAAARAFTSSPIAAASDGEARGPLRIRVLV
jgi:hypothetical protein